MQRSFHLDRRRGLCVLAGLLCLCASVPQSAASEPISVSLASGRHFTGLVDARTDDARLWLRVESGSITLLRPIDWDRVAGAQIGAKKLSADELRAESASLKSAQATIEHDEAAVPPSGGADGSKAELQHPVRSIQIDASLGHWTPTTEATGIVVTLQPLDALGNLVAVAGTLDVDLIGQRLGRWTIAVRPADFGPSGAVYEFSFQAVHPDFHFDLDPHALVHARLCVPGQGTFEISQAMARIRAYSSVRDHVQQATGSRFLPEEQTGQ
jgi:hypothetical protein